MVDYPFSCDFNDLFHPSKSNKLGAERTTRALFRKLHKVGKHEAFHAEILKSIADGRMRFLNTSEAKDILLQPHCFSFLNYTEKISSESQKIRPVSNSSSSHQSGSINSWLPTGQTSSIT